jgi:hypothetical protein
MMTQETVQVSQKVCVPVMFHMVARVCGEDAAGCVPLRRAVLR